ncbi:glycoside hydrolase family 2 TIM barrel-domain containing protein [Zunongwangia endophytica]|uniref:Glycoside hydrolase family 2 TIM barrel-domain containing protein n=1 Tax=Zunongwangia endophytica TaxID=1808945 RepID=A0ABV8H735_9FLAO|nr:glycoside hydrolase family 2 TIM barrel-domain containing protein [Zunongwangia endophytica]MDN3595525.1 glycoside hydrolase family 2 TIM barrel-domain containing protein [Zunongwangia endophytica]
MKTSFFTMLLNWQKILLLFVISFPLAISAQENNKLMFNDSWKFHMGELTNKSDANWKNVSLPHDWSIQSDFDSRWASGTGFLPGGIAYYKKNFDVQNYSPNKKYSIYFDGVYKNSEVWINGHFLGKRPNGFIPFQYDLTPYLKEKENEILVKCDHTDYADSRYYTGSGIYRNVYLIQQNPIHFSQWGVFVSTPKIEKDEAEINIQLEIENLTDQVSGSNIITNISNDKGEKVATGTYSLQLYPNRENYIELHLKIDNPELWEPDAPNLYDLDIRIKVDGKLMELWSNKIGIRDFKFDANKGFFLNGKNMLIKGVCIHHDAGALGAAVPKKVWRERFKTLKELGANAIRMSHYPHQDYIYDLADEMGFLVQDEAFDEWEFGKNKWIEGWNEGSPGKDGSHKDFSQWGTTDVEDMVRRNRNHPSIIMWSIGNEIDYPNDPYTHPILDEGRNPQIYGKGYMPDHPPVDQLGKIANELSMSVKKFDTTRPVTAALAGVTMSNFTAYPEILDIVGYNYQEFRYQEDHGKYPNRIIYGSENGDALSAWKAVTDNDFIASQFLWTAFDFIGEAGKWPYRSSGAGIIDLAGKPKPDFYFRKSLWNNAPMVFMGIADSEDNVTKRRQISTTWSRSENDLKYVSAYNNVDSVELFLNDKSLGKKKGDYDGNMIFWKVPFESGELLLKGYDNEGKEVASQTLKTPGSIADFELTYNKEDIENDTSNILIVDIKLIDENGTPIIKDDRLVTLDLPSGIRVLGLESGDLKSHEGYQSNQRNSYQGKLRAYLELSESIQNKDASITIKVQGMDEKKIILK